MTLDLQSKNCDGFNPFSAKPMLGANLIAVFVLAALSLLLTLGYFFSISRMYKNIR